MDQQQRLIASRRAHLTKLLKKITELKETEYGQDEGNISVTLGSCLEQLQRKAQVLSELDNKIFELITEPEDLETDIIEAEYTQTHIAEIICTTKSFIEKIKSKNTNQHEGASTASNNTQPTTEIIYQTAHGEAEQVGNQPSTLQEEQNQIESTYL